MLTIRLPDDLDAQLARAVGAFWLTRATQGRSQRERGSSDQGDRAAVTGGQQLRPLEMLIASLLRDNGVPEASIFAHKNVELPGYFRASKQWDLLVVYRDHLLAVVELKSHVGSFGNNQNNRVEEALGSSTDLWTAYREASFQTARRPWLGYLLLLEQSQASATSIRHLKEPHYPVRPEFRQSSYIDRYAILCKRLVSENLYSEAALLVSPRDDFDGSHLIEPVAACAFRPWIMSLLSAVKIGILAIDSPR